MLAIPFLIFDYSLFVCVEKVPAFESKDGKVLLSESDAIAYYVADEALRGGNTDEAKAQVLQWILFAQSELLPAICGWLFPSLSIMPFAKDVRKTSLIFAAEEIWSQVF